jgi:hypothetical protein
VADEARAMSNPASQERVWLIRKNGVYYRPDRTGYTHEVRSAGRYTEAEAQREAAVEPATIVAVHEDDIVTHFGPVYGRPADTTSALCKARRGVLGMSRGLHLVECRRCLDLLEEHLARNPLS